MDTPQIAEKIFNFCKEKYPELDWNCDFIDNDQKIIRCVTLSDNSIKIGYDIWAGLDKKLKLVQWNDNRIGSFVAWINPPTENMDYQYRDQIVFENLAYYNHELSSPEYCALVSQCRKVMLDIFTFILDEIQ